MAIQSHRDLWVWQKSMSLAQDLERLAARLPNEHRYGLAAQLRRASSSIPFNIAEGHPRPTRAYLNHLSIALGSEAEVETVLTHLANVKLVPEAEINALLKRNEEIGRMLNGLVRSLKARLPAP